MFRCFSFRFSAISSLRCLASPASISFLSSIFFWFRFLSFFLLRLWCFFRLRRFRLFRFLWLFLRFFRLFSSFDFSYRDFFIFDFISSSIIFLCWFSIDFLAFSFDFSDWLFSLDSFHATWCWLIIFISLHFFDADSFFFHFDTLIFRSAFIDWCSFISMLPASISRFSPMPPILIFALNYFDAVSCAAFRFFMLIDYFRSFLFHCRPFSVCDVAFDISPLRLIFIDFSYFRRRSWFSRFHFSCRFLPIDFLRPYDYFFRFRFLFIALLADNYFRFGWCLIFDFSPDFDYFDFLPLIIDDFSFSDACR